MILKNCLEPTKTKIIVFVILLALVLLGAFAQLCVKCVINDTGWRCGCNPVFGLMPWSVFIPVSIILLLVIPCVIENTIKKKGSE